MDETASSGGRAYGWHKLVKSVVGWQPTSEFLPPMLAGFAVYFTIYCIGVVLHQTSKYVLPSLIRPYVLDFVKTMTFCAYPFGHGIMRKYYGEVGYMGAMVPVIYLSAFTFTSGDGNPIAVWIKYFKKVIPLWKCVIKTMVQIGAGFAAYHFGMYVLSLELHPDHVDRLKEYFNQFCSTDLKVPVYVGFALEFCAVVYESWFSSQVLTGILYIDTLIKIINSGLLVVGGVHLTGMYMHPAMATGHTWGCGDTSRTAHILIYWVGPMIGVWLSVQVQKVFSIRKYIKPTSGTTSRKGKSQLKPATNGNSNGQDRKQRNGIRKRFYHS